MSTKIEGHNNEKAKLDKSPSFINELSIRLSENTRIRIATFTVILMSAISITWTLAHVFYIAPINNDMEKVQREVSDLESVRDKLIRQKNTLDKSFNELQKSEKIPTLIFPLDKRPIIGRHLTFHWKYDKNIGLQNLVLELVQMNKNGVLEKRYQIPEPHRREMYFEFGDGVQGDFFWRLGTGELLVEKYEASAKPLFLNLSTNRFSDVSRLWSRYGRFSVYPTVVDKIKNTKELIVGITATFLSYDHTIDCKGRPDTYDMDFIEWIAKELKKELGLDAEILVKRKQIIWENLFFSVVNGEVDLVIANITKSSSREERYKGLRFTKGYRTNNQAIIKVKEYNSKKVQRILKAKELKAVLRNKMVGAQNATINLEVAKLLESSFEFKVKTGYASYVDVIDALMKGEIDYGIIDSVRLETVDYPEVERLNIDLYPFLSDFYEQKLGTPEGEQYAIAVAGHGGKHNLLTILDKLIESDDGKKIRKFLEGKHKYQNKQNK